MNVENRTLFEDDNLHILRGLDSDSGGIGLTRKEDIYEENQWMLP